MRPKRTGKTSLTDDELTLFDVLFDKGLSLEQLYRQDFRLLHNLAYSHALTRQQVRSRINRWIKAGWVRPQEIEEYDPDFPPNFELTPEGGHLWELEREPLWDRFCVHFGVYMDNAGEAASDLDVEDTDEEFRPTPEITSIISPTPGIVWDYLRAAINCRSFQADLQQAVFRILPEDDENRLLLSWKDFPLLYELKLTTRECPLWQTEWGCMEARATWWRDTHSLDSLKRKLHEDASG